MVARLPVGPTVAPQSRLPFVDIKTGILTETGKQFLTQLYNQYVGTCRIIPCDCTNVGNVYTLTMDGVQPVYAGYADGDTFAFIASATSTNLVTAAIVTATGALATKNVYKGLSQATANDITINYQYFLTFANSVAAGGSFALR